jgi:hypothetical protein
MSERVHCDGINRIFITNFSFIVSEIKKSESCQPFKESILFFSHTQRRDNYVGSEGETNLLLFDIPMRNMTLSHQIGWDGW